MGEARRMKRAIATALIALAAIATSSVQAAQSWTAGRHYEVLTPAQRTTVPAGKVEVLEVFSYGCIGCNGFEPAMQQLKRELPANAQVAYLPASFNRAESWPLFQRAYFTAQALGIADRTHQAMYDAIWKTGELAVVDQARRQLMRPQPTLEQVARCYERLTGVKSDVFMKTASSFSVDMKMRAADAQVIAMKVPSTPCIVVNGKYRVNLDSIRSIDELGDLVNHLVSKETAVR
jgi:protein dithiol oxidoreductase (disulfide-forming)